MDQPTCASIAVAAFSTMTDAVDDPDLPEGCFEDTRGGSVVFTHHAGKSGFVFSTSAVEGVHAICFDS